MRRGRNGRKGRERKEGGRYEHKIEREKSFKELSERIEAEEEKQGEKFKEVKLRGRKGREREGG